MMKKTHIVVRGLKALTIAAGISLVVILLVAARAEAQVADELWNVGESLESLSETDDRSGAPRTVVVNGAELTIRSEALEGDLDSALDRAEDSCAGMKLGPKSTTLRRQVPERGFVACFTRLGRLGVRGLVRAVRGDVSELGEFHYTYARSSASGVHQLRLELPRIDLAAMFPVSGDAPGFDVRDLPRPRSSQRLLSALEIDAPYHIAIYRLEAADLDAVVAAYQRDLNASGWVLAPPRSSGERVTLVARRHSKTAIITLRATDEGTTISVGTGL